MSNTKTVMGQAANTQGIPLDITDVFSTYLYEGNGSTQTITNGIDLDGEGGIVWIKDRGTASFSDNSISHDGAGFHQTHQTYAYGASSQYITSFNSNGFNIGTSRSESSHNYASWTFRKAPKFFDVVTYTGDGNSSQTIPHNLNAEVGCLIVKALNQGTWNWRVYHRTQGSGVGAYLDSNSPFGSTSVFPSTHSTTDFTVAANAEGLNASGEEYVAYLFAHNDGDGEFGPDGDQDIIKCGSYTGNGNDDGPVIDLGFEPQWLMIKNTTDADSWWMFDTMRGMAVDAIDPALWADGSNAEVSTGEPGISPTPTGFKVTTNQGFLNNNNANLIYIAIRRGPLAQPESGTEVFNTTLDTTNALTTYDIGFPVDMMISSYTGVVTTGNRVINSRLQGFGYVDTDTVRSLFTYGNDSEQTLKTALSWDNNTGFTIPDEYKSGSESVHWSWKRAPGFCDVVAYTGNGTAGRTVSHNLGVAPEMMWVKRRNLSSNWSVYAAPLGNGYLRLNSTNAYSTTTDVWNNTAPTSGEFTLAGGGWEVNDSGYNFIAYLFATVPGVSKVGSYTGTGVSGNDVDCGFSSGARFVLIRRVNGDEWMVFDTTRGITSANNDPKLALDNTGAENQSSARDLDPLNSGFTVNGSDTGMNKLGDTYIFYAIA